MSIKSILFCLFLYVCLVWVAASYFYSGEQVEHVGLLATGAGLAGVLLLILLSRLFGWVRILRAKAAARPKIPPKPAIPVHEDDAALTALLNEAGATLNRMGAASNRGLRPLAGLPAYLLIGPEGSGKTTVFLNAGLEPHLLAGQQIGSGQAAPTQLCNVWLAGGALFIEIAGRAFSGDLERWKRLLRLLEAKPQLSRWRRLWRDPSPGLDLRAVVAFCEVKEFTAASSPQSTERLERQCQLWQERLGAVAEVLGFECPTFVLTTKCDAVPYFSEYFRRLADSEANQVVGCAVLHHANATADADSKRLTHSFNALFHSLAEKRLAQLAHEPDMSRRPAIYEFPRELKRIRPALIQFLTAAFRPHPLRPSPRLCGYYLSGIGEKEIEPALALADSKTRWAEPSTSLDATVLFRGDATQILRGGGDIGAGEKRSGRGLQRRWLFVSELFQTVIPAVRPDRPVMPADLRNEKALRIACAAVCGLCLVLCAIVINSWAGNLRLLHSIRSQATTQRQAAIPTLADLQSLEDLRMQVGRLVSYDRDGPPLGLRWGLYAGDRLLQPMKDTYFRRFQYLLLDPLNTALTARLSALPPNPGPDAAYAPAYETLKAHLMISSGSCKPDPAFLTGILNATGDQIMPGHDAAWHTLANRQIAFYASELRFGNPCKLIENVRSRDRARQYLMNIQGVDRVYKGMLSAAQKAFPKPQRLTDFAPDYKQVLSGPGEMAGVFSSEGFAYIEKASRNKNTGAVESDCVYGGGEGSGIGGNRDRNTELAIRRNFIREYVEHWRSYLASFSVSHYAGSGDAARKLEILSGHKSPLLGLFAMTSNQTNFADVPQVTPFGIPPVVKKAFPSLGKAPTQLPIPKKSTPQEQLNSAVDITKAFQPVHSVVPPGSETWVSEKNAAYIDSLSALGHSMQEIARSGSTPTADQSAMYQAASQNYDKAMDAARQLARTVEPVGVGGLDVTVERLLEAPIRQTQSFIITDIVRTEAGQVNTQLHGVCERLRPTLHRYPFEPAGSDATLDEVAGGFAPNTGAIWKFQAQALAELVVKEDRHWKVKDPSKKPQVTPEMLAFLNRAQLLTDTLYPAGSTQPQLTYILRPKLDASYKDAVVEFQMDGQMHSWESSLQKQFSWPAPPGSKELGVKGSIRIGSVSFPFTSRGGVWAIFRVMGDAEPRAISSKIVEWREIRGGDGRVEPIQPAPVRLEFVEFPGGIDLFNPKFFQDLQCPGKAVQ